MTTPDTRTLASPSTQTNDTPQPLSWESQRRWWLRLQELVRARVSAEQQAAEEYRTEAAEFDRDFEVETRQRSETYETERTETQAAFDKIVIDAGMQYADDHAAAEQEFEDVLYALQKRTTAETEAAQKKHEEDTWMVTSYFDEEAEGSPKQQFELFRTNTEKTRDQLQIEADELEARKLAADQVMKRRRQNLEVEPPKPEKEKGAGLNDLDVVLAQFREACQDVSRQATALKRLRVPALFSGFRPLVLTLSAWGLLFGLAGFMIDPAVLPVETKLERREWLVFSGVVALFPVAIVMGILFSVGRGHSSAVYEPLIERYLAAQRARQRWQKVSAAEFKQRESKFVEWQKVITQQRDAGLKRANDELASTLQAIEQRRATEYGNAQQKYPSLLRAITQRRDQDLATAETEFPQKLEKLKARCEWELDKRRKQHDEDLTACSRRYQQKWMTMAEQWLQGWQQLQADAAAANRQANEVFRDWPTLASQPLKLPMQVPPGLRVGQFAVSLAEVPQGLPAEKQLIPASTAFTIPACLPFPEQPSMLLKVYDEGRAAAVAVLQSTMLRLLTTVPGGKVRFTILDPVGLGDNFAAFMHLADYDELMITSRIWTAQPQIDQRLADLTEHMENVFQKYLRNEFRSIQEYNEHAGEVAEPYQVLVVANFPANFTESAARHLISIASSGPRCGVFVLASTDMKMRLPLNFDLKDLECNATVFEWAGNQFVSLDPDLKTLRLTLDAAPDADLFTKLVKEAGHESKDARRVEVAFERIAPKDAQLWTGNSRGGLDFPLGRAGATKLQHLRLGKGTSQHVLIAGKTGSGKSTFLHILITNAALHYGPEQLQFYLIDFKKGVEFKTYATHELPHARVIAIESDREFGVSVLERLDGILKERGDLFRDLGVQDLAGFRDARPDQPMPRILLVVDEFQEFFVEDDKHSQTAALLLDRLVRQGRAFGIHVLLGSQTLGGAYSLARSTLGQMAVRIALQCSESDAHLILSEDNTAARLLTRPGEAIYNDANGLMEGNHPFQIAWLDDDRRDFFLAKVQNQTLQRQIRVNPAMVFEGNIPADPRRNGDLALLIDSPQWDARVGELVAWLGEAVAIKDPTSIGFHRQGGQNVLIVGQNEPAVIGLLTAAIVSLACQVAPEPCGGRVSHSTRPENGNGEEAASTNSVPQFMILDGSLGEETSLETWRRLKDSLPHSLSIGEPRDVPEVLAALSAEITRRESSGLRNAPPIVVVIYNLGRFRDLRKSDDEFGFGFGGGEKKTPPSKQFAEILKNGPGLGVHTLVWSDTYNNVSRWFSSQTLREFEMRIVFQLSMSDSSNLIDSPAAGKLGPNRAILHLVDQGSNEKFRPYGLPTSEWLDDVARRLRGQAVEHEPDSESEQPVPVGEDLSQFTIL